MMRLNHTATFARIVLIVLLGSSCGSEKQYFKKALTRSDKDFLSKNDSLIKDFNGRTNWYKQYWNGPLLVHRTHGRYDFKQVGKWKQTSKDGTELYATTNFDEYGFLKDEKIFAYDGGIDVETTCKKDTINKNVVLECQTIWNYTGTNIIRRKSRSIIKGGKSYKHGRWEYFSQEGKLMKIEEYVMNKRID
ncbi:MAG TPA: hypothetical protein VGD40_18710 [Chryseosolibacter sp.]